MIWECLKKGDKMTAIELRNKYLKFEEFDSPQELLEKFRIDGHSLKEIWNELEW